MKYKVDETCSRCKFYKDENSTKDRFCGNPFPPNIYIDIKASSEEVLSQWGCNFFIEKEVEVIFESGDIIKFCDEEYLVVENNGDYGTVHPLGGRVYIGKFYWEYEGEKCELIRRAK